MYQVNAIYLILFFSLEWTKIPTAVSHSVVIHPPRTKDADRVYECMYDRQIPILLLLIINILVNMNAGYIIPYQKKVFPSSFQFFLLKK